MQSTGDSFGNSQNDMLKKARRHLRDQMLREQRNLTFMEPTIRQIRQQYLDGDVSVRQLAKNHDVSYDTMRCILRGVLYSDMAQNLIIRDNTDRLTEVYRKRREKKYGKTWR